MMNPMLWQSIPFKDQDSFLDFLRVHDMAHLELAKVSQTFWTNLDDLRQRLDLHTRMHNAVADFFGLPHVEDLESFDLTNEDSYVGWMLLNAQDHARLNAAAGIS